MQASMHEAKTSLSQLVERAVAGEEVILTKGKARIPVARIVPVDHSETAEKAPLRKRPLGLYAGQIDIGPEFFEPLPDEELDLWEVPIVSTWKTNDGPEPREGE
jgi:prevent-host-death family protein